LLRERIDGITKSRYTIPASKISGCSEAGIAPGLGPGDRTFEPCHSDQKLLKSLISTAFFFLCKVLPGGRTSFCIFNFFAAEAAEKLAGRFLIKRTYISKMNRGKMKLRKFGGFQIWCVRLSGM
jgi:hypothetical protein